MVMAKTHSLAGCTHRSDASFAASPLLLATIWASSSITRLTWHNMKGGTNTKEVGVHFTL